MSRPGNSRGTWPKLLGGKPSARWPCMQKRLTAHRRKSFGFHQCGRQESNLHVLGTLDPKSSASANSATPATHSILAFRLVVCQAPPPLGSPLVFRRVPWSQAVDFRPVQRACLGPNDTRPLSQTEHDSLTFPTARCCYSAPPSMRYKWVALRKNNALPATASEAMKVPSS